MIDVFKKAVLHYQKFVDKTKELNDIKISQVVKICYYANGSIDVFYSYNDSSVTFSVMKNSNFFHALQIASPGMAGDVGITKEKIVDVEKLLPYLSVKARMWYKKVFGKTNIKQCSKTKEKKLLLKNTLQK